MEGVKSKCPFCEAKEIDRSSSLHVWEITFKCGCSIMGAISSGDGRYFVDFECPNKK
jgi:ribosomal protein L37AE/L43A